MGQHGYFPLESVVHVDPDHFKHCMPEWSGYVERDARTAGDMCHRESGFLQEIAQEVAMVRTQNVWVDGSLRDGPWFARVFSDVRRRFPRYKIAIFEISASEAVVRERIAARAKATGRNVPEHLIRQSVASVASSLEILTPLADFVARIGNDGTEPRLRMYSRVDSSGDWGRIESRFAKPETAGRFPFSMAPLSLISVASDVITACSDAQLSLQLTHPGLKRLGAALHSPEVCLSRRHAVTLDSRSKQLASIPASAVHYAFAYPASGIDWDTLPVEQSGRDIDANEDAASLFALCGGFVYFDARHSVCAINAITNVLDVSQVETGDPTSQHGHAALLQFATPLPLSNEAIEQLDERLHPVTLAALLYCGATRFAWITPSEQFAGMRRPPPAGAFVYVFKHGRCPLAGYHACYYCVSAA